MGEAREASQDPAKGLWITPAIMNNQPTNSLINQPTNQWQPTNGLVNNQPSTNQLKNQPTIQPTNEVAFGRGSTNQPTNQATNQPNRPTGN